MSTPARSPTQRATTRHEYSTRHSTVTPSSPKRVRRLPRNDDGEGRTTLKERELARRVGQPPQRRGKLELPSAESSAPQKQSGTSPITRRRPHDDRASGVHREDARRRQPRNNDGKIWQDLEKHCPEGWSQKHRWESSCQQRRAPHHQNQAQNRQRWGDHHKTANSEASKRLHDVHSLDVLVLKPSLLSSQGPASREAS